MGYLTRSEFVLIPNSSMSWPLVKPHGTVAISRMFAISFMERPRKHLEDLTLPAGELLWLMERPGATGSLH